MIEYLSSRHSQFDTNHCINKLTRPQLHIWYETTLERELKEKINEEKSDWNKFSNLMSIIANTSMGNKKKYKAKDFMPSFDDSANNNDQNKIKLSDFNSKEELYKHLEKKEVNE